MSDNTPDGEQRVWVDEDGLHLQNFRIENPELARWLKAQPDPTEALMRVLREGARVLHGGHGTGEKSGRLRP